jgi:hypothetical protein
MIDSNFPPHAKRRAKACAAYIFSLGRRPKDKAKDFGRGEWRGIGQTVMFMFWSLVGNLSNLVEGTMINQLLFLDGK